MFRTSLKNLAARKLRLLTTSFAVLLGVAFMAGTLVLTDTIGRTFDTLFADATAGTDAYVRAVEPFSGGDTESATRPRLDADLIDQVRRVDGVAAADLSLQGYAQIVGADGKALGDPGNGPPTFAGNWSRDPRLNSFELAQGRAPSAPGEVVIDRGSAEHGDLHVGDTTRVVTTTGSHPVTVVGIATFGGTDSPGGATYALFTDAAAQRVLGAAGKADGIALVADRGVSQTELASRVRTVLPKGTEVRTGEQITEENQTDIKQELSFFNTFLLTFAVIALFVGSFIIYNTFSILVAQRGREMALMRALGASRRQVLSSVLVEAVAVGLIASVLGLLAGIGVASLLRALLGALGIDLPAGDMVVATRTVVVSLVAGLGVSMAAALFPARRASKVPPIAALRDLAIDGSGGSRARMVAGTVVAVLGGGAMAAGLSGGGIALVGLGALLVFLGVAALGPVLARPVSRLIGAPIARLRGMAGVLARENAVRNPKRTSATAAALMIGVALVASITVLASSTKASVASTIDSAFAGDYVIDSGSFGSGGLSPDVARRLGELPEVGEVTGVRVASARLLGRTDGVMAADPRTVGDIFDIGVTQGSLRTLGAHRMAMLDTAAAEHGLHLGDTVDVTFPETGTQTFTIGAIYTESDMAGSWLFGTPAFDANVADTADFQLFLTKADGVSDARAATAINRVMADYPQAKVEDRAAYKAAQAGQIDKVVNLIYALLALAVIIALMGIANTLALSIFERTRELGLLRAVGMSRSQLRSAVRWESVIIALFGTLMGLVIGMAFGWSFVTALKDEGLGVFRVPGLQLVVVTVVAALAGVAAAVLPARRAARLDVLEAITTD